VIYHFNSQLKEFKNHKSQFTIEKFLILLALCTVVYAPAFNNGFISDDYVLLERVREAQNDSYSVLGRAPDLFRSTTYLSFAVLRALFGYTAPCFYAFALCVHFFNCLMLWYLVTAFCARENTGFLAAVFFASIQNPQEAVMWLSAMNELLLLFFFLSTCIVWFNRRFLPAPFLYLLALFSKESAIAGFPMLLLAEREWNKSIRWQKTLYLMIPLLIFMLAFLTTSRENPMISHGFYSLGPHGFWVLLNSLHKLAFPWLYLALLLFVLDLRRWPRPSAFLESFIWLTLPLLPYVFLTYQNHVPSRHEYLASSITAGILAILVTQLKNGRMRGAFLVFFLLGNLSYIWLVKDHQFELRAAPTTALIRKLQAIEPQPVIISDFPLIPWIARLTTRHVDGWSPQHVIVGEPVKSGEYVRLRWDDQRSDYQ
jgi:hypothetical protein